MLIVRLTGGKGLNGEVQLDAQLIIKPAPSLHPLRHDPRAASTYECECEEGLRPTHTLTEAGGKLVDGACPAWPELD